jgi:Tfp pilus assembly protein PilF
MDEKALEQEIVSYSESLYPKLHLGWSALRGLETERYRYIAAPNRELYDLVEDPRETLNCVRANREKAQELERKLEELTGASSPSEMGAERTIDSVTEAMLSRLGYVSSDAPNAPLASSAIDPKQKMALWNRIQLAIFQFGKGDYDGCLDTLTPVLEGEKDIPVVYDYMGSSHMRLKHYREAERIYRTALARGIESTDVHTKLGLIHFYRQELVEAEQELRSALTLDPQSVSAHYHLADVYRAGRKNRQAIDHYRRALELNPSYVYALNGLGMTLARVGRNEDALRAFSRVVEIDPEGARGYFNQAVQLERMDQTKKALAAYEKFMSLATEELFPRERQRAAAAIARFK